MTSEETKVARAEQRKERMRTRHWAVATVFDEAMSKGLAKHSWRDYSVEIKRLTGVDISPGTLKYWYAGLSEPKTSELEAMAVAVGYELELMILETVK